MQEIYGESGATEHIFTLKRNRSLFFSVTFLTILSGHKCIPEYLLGTFNVLYASLPTALCVLYDYLFFFTRNS